MSDLIRTWKNGDTMVPKQFTIYPQNGNVTDWADPFVEVLSAVVDNDDGEVYYPSSIGFDKIRTTEAVSRGIWTEEERQVMIGLCLKLYCRVGDPIVETLV